VQIFLDTANLEEIREAVSLGVISGVTTNPSLVARESTADYEAVVREICSLVEGPVSAEVIATDAPGMVAEARIRAGWAPNVVVKIPITAEGLRATAILSRENISVNMTLCFSANQAILAAAAGADYVSPFVGRLDDIGQDGMQLVRDIVAIYDYYALDTEVIAASIRHPVHCLEAARAGAHIVTVPYRVLRQMIEHPLTSRGLEQFLQDWHRVTGTPAKTKDPRKQP